MRIAVGLAWWEVVAAPHRVLGHACCHLQADFLESGDQLRSLRQITNIGTFTFTFTPTSLALVADCVKVVEDRPIS